MAVASKASPIRSIKLTPQRIADLMVELDRAAEKEKGKKSCRAHERISCQADAVIVKLEPVGLPAQQFVVPIRNISEGGVAFLHDAMLQAGLRCTIYVLLGQGRSFKTTGTVVRCRHLQGMIHEVGMKFDAEVSIIRGKEDGAK